MATSLSTSRMADELPEFFHAWQGEQDQFEQSLLKSFDELESWRNALAAEAEQIAIERAELKTHRAELARTQQQTSAEIADELAGTQAKLAAAEEQLRTFRKRAAETQQSIDQQQTQRAAQEEQHAALELELEHARNRAGEVADALAKTRTDLERERAEWAREKAALETQLDNQRKLLQKQRQGPPHEAPEAALREPISPEEKTPADADKDDTVVGSVLAQFERIRNERSVRRRKTDDPGK